MMMEGFISRFRNVGDAMLAIAVVGLVLLLIIPLPPILLDAFLCFSIVLSVMALLLTLYVENALEFSAFPSLLLFLTLFRLGLNVSSTRMILTRCEGGDIIKTFGGFVTQNNLVVGLILFALLTIINFIVVTKGAGRIAEVAARFTLEALPGKQLAIDGEVSSGLISQQEAKAAREKIGKEAEFYGAMDGASKFVRGDAIAGLIITAVNIIGGMIIGIVGKGLAWDECLKLFTRLTVGDGLVSQIPALLISVGAGIMVTRASSGNLSKTLTKEVFQHPKVLIMGGLTLLILGLIPGMPFFVMAPISGTLFLYSYLKSRNKEKKTEQQEKVPMLFVHPIEVHLGMRAVNLADPLHRKLGEIRKTVARHLGVRVPSVHITDNLELTSSGWAICVKGTQVVQGHNTDLLSLSKKLTEVIEEHAYELINRQDVAQLIQEVKSYNSAVVDELIPKKLSLGQVLKVLQNLLKENVPIRDFITILEVLADQVFDGKSSDVAELTEEVRKGLSRGISDEFFGKTRVAHVITLDPKVEQMFRAAKGNVRPSTIDKLARELIDLNEKALQDGVRPVVLTAAPRSEIKRMIERHLPKLPVLSYAEVTSEVDIRTVGVISNEVLIGTA